MGELPGLNPFPIQATTAVEEGPFVESYRTWARTTPTLTVEPVRRLTALTQRFRNSAARFGQRVVVDAHPRGEGQAAIVYGPHGSGKTHAIRAAVGEAATESDQPFLLPLYTKLSDPNVVNMYRRLMAQLSITELQDLALRFLGSLTSSADPLTRTPIQERLRADPSSLLTMFSEHVLERGLLLQAQADRLRTVVTGEQDFQRALTYLLEPDLQDAAYEWLLAKPISDAQLRRLGLSGPIDTPDECQYGLRLITLICSRAGRPLVLILDQAEKFVPQPAGPEATDSTGFLHSLVEAVPELGGMLIVAANDDTWAAFPPDLRQRFGANDIACAAVQPGQALELLGLYILAAYGAVPPAGYRAPQPFTEEAVLKLLTNSGGNVRSLLQLAWQSFDRLEPGRDEIGPDLVPDQESPYDRGVVEAAVRRALWRLGRPVRDPRPGFQYAVWVGETGRVLVRVTEAMFYLDEADRAEEDIRVRFEATGEATLDRHVLIVIGYASRDVLHLLSQVYDDVLVYREEDAFTRQLTALIKPDALSAATTSADLDEARDRLADVGWSRSQAASSLSSGVASVTQRAEAERTARRYEELSERWPAERDRLVQRLAELRRERDQADLEELHRVATEDHRRRRLLRLAWTAVLPFGLLVSPAVVSLTSSDPSSLDLSLALAVAAVAGIVLMAAAVLGVLRLEAPRPVSLSEAERIARDRFRPGGRVAAGDNATTGAPEDLRAADPYRRWGCLLVGLRGETTLQLRRALRVERVRLVRRVIAGRLGTHLSRDRHTSLTEVVEDADRADLPYLLEGVRSPYWNEVAELPPPARILLALVNRYGMDIRAGNRPSTRRPGDGRLLGPGFDGGTLDPRRADPVPVEEDDPAVRLTVAAAAGDGAFGAAYRKGVTLERLLRALDEADERDLRRAAKFLSPDDGLGAAHHLEVADELDRLHLFVEQLLFYRDGGISPMPRP